MKLPLEGLVVLEFSQYLSGPSAGLRLADLGARVIKIERPNGGDACRKLSIKNLWVGDDSLLFHTINRNKESFTANLKDPNDIAIVKKLIAKADVITHNFRPGIIDKIGLDYKNAKAINPRIVYGEISGFGTKGPWRNLPGQDLLLQSMSGLVYTSGNEHHAPVPFGLAIADSLCGAQLVQGILGALIRRKKTGEGGHIEISLMESILDFQFELLTTYHASGQIPKRSGISNGHPLLSAPYGIYATADGFIAIAMMGIHQLADAIDCKEMLTFLQEDAFVKRDEIKAVCAKHLLTQTSDYWLQKLHTKDMWAMEVLDWQKLVKHQGYKVLGMEQKIKPANEKEIITTRCPIKINGQKLYSNKPAPKLGEHNKKVLEEFDLN
jgi:CoA:oxalate CoA-transferase